MGRNFSLLVSNKNLVELAVLAALALAGIFIIRQIQHVSAAAPSGQVHTIGSSSTDTLSSADTSAINPSGPVPAAQNTNHTSLSVNGQPVEVPENGSVTQTISNGNSTTTVNAQSSTTASTSQGSASNSSHSSVNINVHSSSGDSR
jgi:hypothetical protein